MSAESKESSLAVRSLKLIDTEIGTIGQDWKVVPLSEVAEKPKYGLTAKAGKSGNVRFLRITDITSRGVNWETVPFCSASKKKIDPCRLKSGDIVFARIGATTGKSYLISNPPDAVFASYLIRVRVGEKLDPSFLIHYFQSTGYWKQVDANKQASIKMGINGSILNKLLLPLPPLPEQKKIAHILSTVQRAIEAQESIIQTTTELKKALMHKLFTEGLRNEPQKQTEIGSIPKSWSVLPFDQFVTLQRGSDLRKQDFRQGPVPVIGATQVIGYHDTANVKAPGVTVVRSGSSAGKPLFISEDFWAHNVLLYVKDFQGNHPKFVYYKIIDLDLTQYRQGVAVPTLNRNTFSSVDLSLPLPSEQQDIAYALDAVGKKTEIASRKKAQLQDLFRTLLQELMTANTRVHELKITT